MFIAIIQIIKNGLEHPDPSVNKQAASLFTKMISDHFQNFEHLASEEYQLNFIGNLDRIIDNLDEKIKTKVISLDKPE